jgi:nucleoside-diphosphate-sugar epimerase
MKTALVTRLGCPDHERVYEDLPRGDVNHTFADNTRAHMVLDWRPNTTIETGIKNFVDWVKNNE